jgi:LruC domain-containing protein
VHEGAGYKNVLGFYKYKTSTPPTSISQIDTVRIIFPNVSFSGSGGGLNSGNRVYLGQFGPGTEIAWMLIADGFVNGAVTNGRGQFYSDKNLNPETNPANRQHVIFCNDIGRGKFLLGFEDLSRNGGADNDFNDAIFYVTADPIQSVNTSNIPLPNYTQPDSDGDGISNAFDDFPDNPGQAFNNYYPSENSNGTLSFEDLWPEKGDYDMNDVVIDYNFNQVTNGQNKVVSITGAMTLRAMGAGYKNGFGIQLPILTNQVTSATGMHITESYITNSANGTESGQSKATVIVFDNGYTVLQKPAADPYVGVNTSPGCIYVNPVTININIGLSAPVSLSVLGTPPYNPFVIVNKTRGREIHLVNKSPTDLADPTLFGTGDDTSIPGSNRYYSTSNNLPWAFDIIDQFDYPIEKKPILNGYLKFAPWTTSGGAVNYDWFAPNPGYRNNQYIFDTP